ncbi:transaldolase b [Trichoderma arundinaceum]|uniref:Transaldolase b n=1 Tax=Trichoderma arundinaceum TaxID=490622 RepID=A0A395NYJ4_TRIAR|nr:transaldolase b [Trichoderma arundinaceum]
MSSTENTSPPIADQANLAAAQSSPDRNKKKRIRNWTADDRAAHRVFERSRREAFKERLTTLAGLIPSLRSTDPNRLSKHVVIDQSVALHKAEQQRIAESLHRIDRLVAERDDLLSELNTWRLNAGLEARPARVTTDDSEDTSATMMDDAGASMLRASVSSIGASNEHGAAGSGPIYLKEQSSFLAAEDDLETEAVLAPAVEPDLPSASISMNIPWMSTELDFTIPNPLTVATSFSDATSVKSPSYTHLPMPYEIATNNVDDETLRFNTTVMHIADPSSFHNDTYIYTG